MWHVMMSRLAPRSKEGDYIRPESEFRQWVQPNADAPYPAEANRYHLIVGMGCPWAHRTLIVRALKGLDTAIPVTVVVPSPEEGGWIFEAPKEECHTLKAFYQRAYTQQTQSSYQGRSTVPVLWDSHTQTIVNNESAEIIVMLNHAFNAVSAKPDIDLYPQDLHDCIEQWNQKIYPAVNNGVYRCGFAQTQAAYERAIAQLFQVLDEIDGVLATQRYLCGDRLTLADVRLFTTLFRFDIAYYGIFKCNRKRIQDYPNLGGYLRDLYQHPGIADTCDLDAVKRDYYGNLFPLNPGGIVPAGPDIDYLWHAHGREALSASTGGEPDR
jgi:putative glutathione S-transferase